jgi:hypothetical protein
MQKLSRFLTGSPKLSALGGDGKMCMMAMAINTIAHTRIYQTITTISSFVSASGGEISQMVRCEQKSS